MRYTASHIAAITDSIFQGSDSEISQISFDSRRLTDVDYALFIALDGTGRDGHDYLSDAYNKGYRTFIAKNIPVELKNAEATWILSANPLKALQKLAAFHRLKYNYPVIAITGSHGKTITKEWLHQITHKEVPVVRSPKSYNSQIGVPLSVLLMDDHHQLAIIEAGISERHEMSVLHDIIQPSHGIFTNLGRAHDSGFSNDEEKIYEKFKLFRSCKSLVCRIDNLLIEKHAVNWQTEGRGELITWAFDNKGAMIHAEVNSNNDSSDIVLTSEGETWKFTVPFTDSPSIENAINAWCGVLSLDMDVLSVTKHFNHLLPVEMRLNQKSGINNCTLICDYYNSDLTSLELALNWMNRQENHQRRTVILSDILQSGMPQEQLTKTVASLLERHQIDRLIAIGEQVAGNLEFFNFCETITYSDTPDFLNNLGLLSFERETILIKGSREFAFEHIERRLQRQVHNTVLEVSMNALRHNLQYFRNRIRPETRLMAMVKAYSYGSGGHEVAHLLQHEGVDYLAVAYADEGISLRKDGIHLPIMVMNSDADSYELMLDYDLEPEVFSFDSLLELTTVLKRHPERSCKVHIELNSGMNRLGFNADELGELTKRLKLNPQIQVESIFSHLAMSDEQRGEAFTEKQIEQFEEAYSTLVEKLDNRPLKHILNSSGILSFPHAQGDMVRLGIGLYGIDPSNRFQGGLEHVGTLWSTISQIREVDAGEGIGYGQHSVANHKRKVAVVAIGYADGLSRSLSQGKGYFNIAGAKAPIVGNICMDMTMCDVTSLSCQTGDRVQIFGEDPTIQELANILNTIPYEILTSVSQRVKRVYTEE